MWSSLFISSATSSNQVYCTPLDSYCCSIKELKTLEQGTKLIIALLIIFYHVNCFLTNFTSTAAGAAISSFHVSFLWTTTSDANFKLVFSVGLILKTETNRLTLSVSREKKDHFLPFICVSHHSQQQKFRQGRNEFLNIRLVPPDCKRQTDWCWSLKWWSGTWQELAAGETWEVARQMIAVVNLFSSWQQNDLMNEYWEFFSTSSDILSERKEARSFVGCRGFWNVAPIICVFPELKWGQRLFHPKKEKKRERKKNVFLMNCKQHEIKALWEGGGADKLCQALFKNTRGFVFLFGSFAPSDTTNPLFTSARLFCLTLVLPLPSFALPSRSSPGLHRSHFHFASIFKQYVSATCQWTPRKWGKFILYFYCLFRFLEAACKKRQFWKAAFCDVTDT